MAAFALQYHNGQGWRVNNTFLGDLRSATLDLPAVGEKLRILNDDGAVVWQNDEARNHVLRDDLDDQVHYIKRRLKNAADSFQPVTLQPSEAILLFRVLGITLNEIGMEFLS